MLQTRYDTSLTSSYRNRYEKAKVSYFEKENKVLLTYNYGDSWEFEVDPEMIDSLMGGEAIDLDKFDKAEFNQRMEQYKE